MICGVRGSGFFFRFDFLVFLARKSIFWVEEEFWKAIAAAVGSQQTDLFWLSELDSGETRTRQILIITPIMPG